jgi:hypothetical protein
VVDISEMDSEVTQVTQVPDITVRHLITIDEMLANNPTFLAFTEKEIASLLTTLLNVNSTDACDFEDDKLLRQKTAGLVKLHSAVLNQKKGVLPTNILPFVEATVKHTDNTFVTSLSSTLTIADYEARQKAQGELAFPYDVESSVGPATAPVPKPTDFVMSLDEDEVQIGVITEFDKNDLPISGFVTMNKYESYENDYLRERVQGSSRMWKQPKIERVVKSSDFKACILPFNEVLDTITELPTIHHLDKLLSLYTLTAEQVTSLVEKLEKIAELTSSTSATEETNPTKQSKQSKPADHSKSGFEANRQAALLTRLKDRMTLQFASVEAKAKLDAKSKALTDMINSMPPVFGTVSDSGMFNDLVAAFDANQSTLIEQLKMAREKEKHGLVVDFVRSMVALLQKDTFGESDNITTKFDNTFRRTLMAKDAFAVESNPRQFVDTYNEVADVRKGSDDSKYMGDMNDDNTYQVDTLYKMSMPSSAQTVGSTITAPVLSAPGSDKSDQLSKYITTTTTTDIPEGVREVLVPVVIMLEQILSASGLPIVMDEILTTLSQMTPVMSRAATIKSVLADANLDDIDINIVRALVTFISTSASTPSAALEAAMNMYANIPEEFGSAFASANSAFKKSVKQALLRAIALWTMQIQTASLNGQNVLELSQGMVSCIQFWAPYGPPLASAEQGAMVYLCAIASELSASSPPTSVWKTSLSQGSSMGRAEIMSGVLALLKDGGDFAESADMLKTAFDAVEKGDKKIAIDLMAQKDLDQVMMVAPALRNPTSVLAKYHNVLLMLPRVYRKDKSALMYPGCCVQKVGTMYAPDKDIVNYANEFNAHKLMQLPEAKQWLKSNLKGAYKFDRFRLTFIEKPFDNSKPHASHAPGVSTPDKVKGSPDGIATLKHKDWLMNSGIKLLSNDEKADIIKNSTQAKGKAEKRFDELFKAANLSQNAIRDIKEYLVNEATSDDLEAVIRMVPVELAKIRFSTYDKVELSQEERDRLGTWVSNINELVKHLRHSSTKTEEVSRQFVKSVLMVLCANVLALPLSGKASGTKAAFETMVVSALASKLAKQVLSRRKMSHEDIAKIKAHRREEYKNTLIKRSERLSDEQRKLMKVFKDLKLPGFHDEDGGDGGDGGDVGAENATLIPSAADTANEMQIAMAEEDTQTNQNNQSKNKSHTEDDVEPGPVEGVGDNDGYGYGIGENDDDDGEELQG